jgi:hypothetical protein
VFDREAQNTYSIRVRTTDRLGLSFEQELTITVNDVNEPTTALALDNTTIPENESPGRGGDVPAHRP